MKFERAWRSRRFLLLMILLGLGAVFSRPVSAAVFDDDGRIGADEVIDDDVFLRGTEIVIDGTVNGIVFAAGSTIVINGEINGDAFLAGYDITLTEGAVINGNLFTGAYRLTQSGLVTGSSGTGAAALFHNGQVERNLYFSGYHLETRSDSEVGLDLYAAAYQALLNGSVERDLGLNTTAAELYGGVGSDVNVRVSAPNRTPFFRPYILGDLPNPMVAGLRIFPEAEIQGSLTYTSPIQQERSIESIPAGGIIHQTPIPGQQPEIADWEPFGPAVVVAPFLHWLVGILRNLILLLILGGLTLWLLPRLLPRLTAELRANPVGAAGYGAVALIAGYITFFFLFLIVLSIGIFLLVVSLGGLSRTILTTGFSATALGASLFTFLAFQFSRVVVAFLLGEWAARYIAPRSQNRRIWALLLGVLIYVSLRAIPIFGWFVALAATLFALGAMWLAYRNARRPAEPPPAAV